MYKFPILALFICAVAITSATDVPADGRSTVQSKPSSVPYCPSSTFAKCEFLIGRLSKRRREKSFNRRNTCRSYEEVIECYKSLKVDIACQEDLQSKTNLMVMNARINECKVQDVRFMVVASEEAPTSCRNTIAIAAILTIVITGFVVFAFRYQFKKYVTHVNVWF